MQYKVLAMIFAASAAIAAPTAVTEAPAVAADGLPAEFVIPWSSFRGKKAPNGDDIEKRGSGGYPGSRFREWWIDFDGFHYASPSYPG